MRILRRMVRPRTRQLLAPFLVAAAVACFAGCGEDDGARTASGPTSSGSASSTSSAPADAPECDQVWSEGATLPRGYRGCTDESGAYVERDALGCSSGQRMVTYVDRYYGVLGGTIHEVAASLEEDRDYQAAVRSCRA